MGTKGEVVRRRDGDNEEEEVKHYLKERENSKRERDREEKDIV